MDVPKYDDGFLPVLGLWGQPMPVGADGKTGPERGYFNTLAEQREHLEWMRFNADPSYPFAAMLPGGYVGSPDYQHGQWLLAQTSAGGGTVVGPV